MVWLCWIINSTDTPWENVLFYILFLRNNTISLRCYIIHNSYFELSLFFCVAELYAYFYIIVSGAERLVLRFVLKNVLTSINKFVCLYDLLWRIFI